MFGGRGCFLYKFGRGVKERLFPTEFWGQDMDGGSLGARRRFFFCSWIFPSDTWSCVAGFLEVVGGGCIHMDLLFVGVYN
jgi:hypothetical protein